MLLITLGDPFSINIEAIATLLGKSLSHTSKKRIPFKIVIIGSKKQWHAQTHHNSFDIPVVFSKQWEDIDRQLGQNEKIFFLDIDDETAYQPASSMNPALLGTLATRSLTALRHLKWEHRLAVLTCPIDKARAQAGGFQFPGQTEFFSDLWTGKSIMVLAGPKLRVGLVTNHAPLSQVAELLSTDLILDKILTFYQFLQNQNPNLKPTIAVTGLNPHASDGGLFGDQEQTIIGPSISMARKILIDRAVIAGPLSADTVFFHATMGHYDGVLAMYHDQGLGPLKTIHFYDAVNITAGLKHLRVSPDHGPASDHFLSGTANLASFEQAYKICQRYLTATW